ncbi:MAG: 16S rRNA (cytosine(967)-C(5))-methyltransferase RsmB, partial [Rickettsiella sp.]|nr:16S rRNA (cytosine(967)-C(5))-methyltransferase RsmB [Rickettsiella sp.]
VLRSFQRQQTVLLKKLPKEIQYAHPQWLLKKLKEAWPENWQAIIQANNQSPLMSLRVNRLKNSREDYLQKLKDNLIEAKSSAISSVGILLNETCKTHGLPDFAEGNVSIQDTAAQLSAFLLKLQPKQTVLDACAAPGGKFTHILETEVDLKTCVAIDKDENRLKKVEENLLRLKLNHDNIQLICANAQEFKTQWQGEQFDRILLDVPCSGTGVIRRHPDIKLLRREQDISKLAKQQLELLLGLWPLLRSSGLLLYVTCSILPEENQDVVQRFLLQQPDSMEDIINAEWGVACKMGRQVFPQDQGTDGFYYARVQKK